MRDDRMKWAPLPDKFLPIMRDGISVSPTEVGRQFLVSGMSDTAYKDASGWPDIVVTDTYSLRLSRDQSLQVGGPARPTGWQGDRAQAVSDMSDGYQVFDVSGPTAFTVLCRGAELDLHEASRSVARRLWGLPVLLYRHGDDSTFRLHVDRSFAMALYTALVTAVEMECKEA